MLHGMYNKEVEIMLNGDLIKRRRKELGLSVRTVAEQMGYAGHWSYYRIECGLSCGSKRQLQLLAEVLGLSWSELLEPEDDESGEGAPGSCSQ